MLEQLRTHASRQDGATAVEYGIMVALIAVVIIGAVFALGDSLTGIFDDTTEAIENPESAE